MTPEAQTAWETVRSAVAESLPPSSSSFVLWIEPLVLAGEDEGALCLVGPMAVIPWVERRYGALIGDVIRKLTDYRGAFFAPKDPPAEERNCL